MADDTTIEADEESCELRAAWERVCAAYAPMADVQREYLRLARDGHRNRLVMLDGEIEQVSGCVYDYDGPCSNEGEPCTDEDNPPERCPYDTPERAEKREALRALLALLKAVG